MTPALLSTTDVSYCLFIFSLYSIPPLLHLLSFFTQPPWALPTEFRNGEQKLLTGIPDSMGTEPLTQADNYILRHAWYFTAERGEKDQSFKQREDTRERGTKQKVSDSTVNARHNNKKKAAEERVLCNFYRALATSQSRLDKKTQDRTLSTPWLK